MLGALIEQRRKGALDYLQAQRSWLNLELVKKPPHCIEYITVHEPAHLLERLHNDRFAALMDRHLPNRRRYRDELNPMPLGHKTWDVGH